MEEEPSAPLSCPSHDPTSPQILDEESDNEDWNDGTTQQIHDPQNDSIIEVNLIPTKEIKPKRKRKYKANIIVESHEQQDQQHQEELESEQKQRKQRQQLTRKKEKQQQEQYYQQQLRHLLIRCCKVGSNCYEEELILICLSILPDDILNASRATPTIDFLQIFSHWFGNNFTIIKNQDLTIEEGRDGSISYHDLIHCIKNSAGSSHQLCQIAIAILTALNMTTRYAVTLDLPSQNCFSDIIPSVWIEVLIFSPRDKVEKWYCVEPLKNIITTNKTIIEQECRARSSCLAYAIAIDKHGKINDITFQYAGNPVRTRSKRFKDERWWENLLKELSIEEESSEEKVKTIQESDIPKVLPMSISGFKDHPYYVLAEHLGKRRTLHPDAKPVAIFSGVPVYLRSDISELKTDVQWKKLNRLLLPNQTPHRILESDTTLEFYAEYQTIPRPIPQIQFDSTGQKRIPTNKHGNIEIWDGKKEYVPAGCVYLSSISSLQAAQQLGIHHVPAVIGFKSIGVMKYAPILEGVVVLEEDVDLITEAAICIENENEEQAKEKKYQKIVKKWMHLTKSILSRAELFEKYGY